ncbi:exopolysaccharide transport family protein [Chitinophaga alhagiae]|uniref:exopolysaccharide transport family protein n=1 Tax=Chitinophaga alhagiae TaxID=2203219 RepID=UPI000E5ACE1B|nr:Wzz/FepE/Etk N-terminal domain-containing protein [Chitinophaga alhagiae]
MDLIYLFNSLMRRKWLIMISSVLAVAIAFLFTMNQEKLYRSSAQMATGFTTSDQVKLKDENFNIIEIDVKFNNVIEALRSTKVLSMVAYNLMLHDLESPDKAFRQLSEEDKKKDGFRNISKDAAVKILKDKYTHEKLLSSYNPDEKKVQELMKVYEYDLESIRKMLSVGRIQKTDFLDVQYWSTNPELSAYMVNEVCSEFLRSNESARSQQNVQSIQTMEKLVAQKKADLDEKINNLRTMGGIDVSVESSTKLEQISSLESRMTEEQNTLNSATLSLQQLTKQLAEMERTNAQTASASSAASAELSKLRTQMNEANQEYISKGAKDQELYNKYTKLKAAYRDKLNSLATSATPTGTITKADLQQKQRELELQANTSQQNIETYRAKIRELTSSVGAAASRSATNLALQKEMSIAQTEYENIKSRYDAVMNNTIVPLDNFRQILYGQPAAEAERSKRLIILALAGMCMFVFCCIAIIFLEYVDVSIKTPSQFLKTVGLKLLGVVNKVNMKKQPIADIFDTEQKKDNQAVTFREHLRKLRFEIENKQHKIYLFTSARPREGKSTIIKALAHSLSKSQKKVLIIDTNFINNTLTREFEAKQELESFSAAGKYDYKEIQGIITPTGIEGVDIIGCQGGDYTPAEVLGDENLLNNLAPLTAAYDYILMEGAALNVRSDSKELLNFADTMISVVSAKSTIKQTDKESFQYLQSMNGKFTGAVLNCVNKENIDM